MQNCWIHEKKKYDLAKKKINKINQLQKYHGTFPYDNAYLKQKNSTNEHGLRVLPIILKNKNQIFYGKKWQRH